MSEKREIKEIIWDADNTIWNWVRYAARAYPKMAATIAEETGIPADDVIAAMKKYYTATGTLESPWLIQGLEQMGFFKRAKKRINIEELRLRAKAVFQHYRNKYFKKYPGVGEVMKTAHEQGIKNRILTDAPRIQAVMRIKRSKLDEYITSIHAVKTRETITNLPPEIAEAQKNGKYDINCEVEELEVEKPDTRLEHILKISAQTSHSARSYIQKCVAIAGDNDAKDMELARRYGCLGIHAQWGKPDPADLEVLKHFAPEKIVQKNMEIAGRSQGKHRSHRAAEIVPIHHQNEIRKKMLEAIGIEDKIAA
ncbi:HAD hydrolase-like protein [Patescibacteria group bacterium]|nr:HAD hydrolase-like protein [Patescibacteria group bacterium]